MIRDAAPDDIPGILEIWNPVIRDTAITFTDLEKTPQGLAAALAEKAAAGHAFLVAHDGAGVAGLATFGPFRNGPGYRHTFEHTILLHPRARGQGLGRVLMETLCDRARAAGGHSIFAGVSAENPAGVAFHAAMGFATVARLPRVGRKFGRWMDLVLMQKFLATD